MSQFPKEIIHTSESLAAETFPDLRYFHEVDRGGYFAAWQQPSLFVAELRAPGRALRR